LEEDWEQLAGSDHVQIDTSFVKCRRYCCWSLYKFQRVIKYHYLF